MSPAPSRSFCLVLHLHMPFVVNHGMWPHGSRWLCEAIVDAYLPLVDLLDRLRGRGVRPSWTLSVSPVLAEQLASPKVRTATREFLAHRLAACADDRHYFERMQHEPLVGLTHHWETHLRTLQAVWDRIDGDLLRSLREFQAQGLIELMTSAASHAYLPLLGQDESIHLQIRQGVECHRRHFGVPPRGLWLPECGYRPRYEWRAPVGVERTGDRRLRPGLEEFLPSHGLGFFVLDHGLIADVPPSAWYREVFGGIRRLPRARAGRSGERRFRSAHTPYRVASRTGTGEATAFIRDAAICAIVWSRDTGYPGDDAYLEYHKQHQPGGLRYWRVTQRRSNLDSKAVYDPAQAAERVQSHAVQFVDRVDESLAAGVAADGGGMVCAAFDAELFGHWWHEGPAWLEAMTDRLAERRIRSATLSETLEDRKPAETLTPREGSWGEGGVHRVWLNRSTEWMWDRMYDAEHELCRAAAALPGARRAHPLLGRVLTQVARELLLLQSSDWPFMVTTGSVRDYAEWRFAEHYADFKGLIELARKLGDGGPLSEGEEGYVGRLESTNFLFPDLNLSWLALAEGGGA